MPSLRSRGLRLLLDVRRALFDWDAPLERYRAMMKREGRLFKPPRDVDVQPVMAGDVPAESCVRSPRDVQVRAKIPQQQVELPVAVVIGHGNLRADARLRVLIGLEQLAVTEPIVLGDQGDRRFELRPPPPAYVAIPIDAAVGGTREDVPTAVAIPVDGHRVGVLAARHAQWLAPTLTQSFPVE